MIQRHQNISMKTYSMNEPICPFYSLSVARQPFNEINYGNLFEIDCKTMWQWSKSNERVFRI
jgi:hypothetical protein